MFFLTNNHRFLRRLYRWMWVLLRGKVFLKWLLMLMEMLLKCLRLSTDFFALGKKVAKAFELAKRGWTVANQSLVKFGNLIRDNAIARPRRGIAKTKKTSVQSPRSFFFRFFAQDDKIDCFAALAKTLYIAKWCSTILRFGWFLPFYAFYR